MVDLFWLKNKQKWTGSSNLDINLAKEVREFAIKKMTKTEKLFFVLI